MFGLIRNSAPRLVGLFILMAASVGFALPLARELVWDFEGEELGEIAAGFTGEVGRWRVEQDGDSQVLAQRAENRESVFNLALIDETSYKDVDVSVRLKPVGGENERGGGVVWRAKDKDNYYVARYNPHVARHNPRKPSFRLYKVELGKITQLDHAEAPEDLNWHTLRVTMIGREITGYLDGKKLLEAEDSTFLDVGRIGLWTRSDACTIFDDLEVSGR